MRFRVASIAPKRGRCSPKNGHFLAIWRRSRRTPTSRSHGFGAVRHLQLVERLPPTVERMPAGGLETDPGLHSRLGAQGDVRRAAMSLVGQKADRGASLQHRSEMQRLRLVRRAGHHPLHVSLFVRAPEPFVAEVRLLPLLQPAGFRVRRQALHDLRRVRSLAGRLRRRPRARPEPPPRPRSASRRRPQPPRSPSSSRDPTVAGSPRPAGPRAGRGPPGRCGSGRSWRGPECRGRNCGVAWPSWWLPHPSFLASGVIFDSFISML